MLPSDPEPKGEAAASMAHHARAMKMAAEAASKGGRREAKCQVPGCDASITSAYHARHKVCPGHAKAVEVEIEGKKMRFCQQCSKLHVLEEFDGKLKSCKKTLSKHNQRRKMSVSKTNGPANAGLKRAAPSSTAHGDPKRAKEMQAHAPTRPIATKVTPNATQEQQHLPPLTFAAYQRDGMDGSATPSTPSFTLPTHMLQSHPMFQGVDMQHAALEVANSYLPSAESCENIRLGLGRPPTPTQGYGPSDWGERLSLGVQGTAPHLLVPTFSGEMGTLPLQFSQLAAQLHSSFSGAFNQMDPNHMHFQQ